MSYKFYDMLGQLYLSYAVDSFINTCSLNKVGVLIDIAANSDSPVADTLQQRLNEMIRRRDSQASLKCSHPQLYAYRRHV